MLILSAAVPYSGVDPQHIPQLLPTGPAEAYTIFANDVLLEMLDQSFHKNGLQPSDCKGLFTKSALQTFHGQQHKCVTQNWWQPSILDVLSDEDAAVVESHACMFGSDRVKRTCLVANSDIIESLQMLCNGEHDHASWRGDSGELQTSQEAAYPAGFCSAVAGLVHDKLRSGIQQSFWGTRAHVSGQDQKSIFLQAQTGMFPVLAGRN